MYSISKRTRKKYSNFEVEKIKNKIMGQKQSQQRYKLGIDNIENSPHFQNSKSSDRLDNKRYNVAVIKINRNSKKTHNKEKNITFGSEFTLKYQNWKNKHLLNDSKFKHSILSKDIPYNNSNL